MRYDRPDSPQPCQLCGSPMENIAVCDSCVFGARALLRKGGVDNPDSIAENSVVVTLADRCYLCGDGPAEHGDHVVPKSRGGSQHWSNRGGACAKCNLSKHDRLIELTDEQRERLLDQHTRIRKVAGRLTDAVWWQIVESDIENYLYDDWADGLDVIADDPDFIEEDVREWFFDDDVISEGVVRSIAEYIAEVAAAGGLDRPRRTKGARVVHMPAITVDIQAIAERALREARRERRRSRVRNWFRSPDRREGL